MELRRRLLVLLISYGLILVTFVYLVLSWYLFSIIMLKFSSLSSGKRFSAYSSSMSFELMASFTFLLIYYSSWPQKNVRQDQRQSTYFY